MTHHALQARAAHTIQRVRQLALLVAAACLLSAATTAHAVNIPFVAADGRDAFTIPTRVGMALVGHDGTLRYALLGARQPGTSPSVLSESFAGAQPVPGRLAATVINRFIGRDPSQWQTGMPSYNSVTLGLIWPGIRVTLLASDGTLEKRFDLAPGADPKAINVPLSGADRLAIAADGQLIATTPSGEVSFSAPVAWQGQGTPVTVAYRLTADGYGFTVGPYDPDKPLVIDPAVDASYAPPASSADDVVIDGSTGKVFVAGKTGALTLPGTGAAYASSPAGDFELYVARYSVDLSVLEVATFFGGVGADLDPRLAHDPGRGTLYLGGVTTSPDIPGVPLGQTTRSLFVAALSDDLSTLIGATYLGGTNCFFVNPDHTLKQLAVSPATGDLVAVGATCGSDLVGTAGAAQAVNLDEHPTGFVARFTPNLASQVRATYFGGSIPGEIVRAVAFHPTTDQVYIGGTSFSSDLPAGSLATFGPNRSTLGGFVARLDAGLTTVEAMAYLGGSATGGCTTFFYSDVTAVMWPGNGDIYVAGGSCLGDLPGTAGAAQSAPAGKVDAYVSRMLPDLSAVVRTSYVGGTGEDGFGPQLLAHNGVSLGLSLDGRILLAATTNSTDLPALSGSFQPVRGGAFSFDDGFIARFSEDLTTLVRTTYIGGERADRAHTMAMDPSANSAVLVGYTDSNDVPGTIAGAFPTRVSGAGFMARFNTDLAALGGAVGPIDFTDVMGATLGQVVTSNFVTVTGITQPVAISISAPGEYRIGGSAPFSSAPGTANGGDMLQVRLTAATTPNTQVSTVLTVGLRQEPFTVTTSANANDTDPAPFDFISRTNIPVQDPGGDVFSDRVTPTGFNTPTTISISSDTSAAYNINDQGFTTAPGTLSPGDEVFIRQQASNTHGTMTVATLTMGTTNARFEVTTQQLDTSPSPFDFLDQTDVVRGVIVTSNQVIISGINGPAPLSITTGGTLGVKFSINDGPWLDPMSGDTINDGDTLRVQLLSSSNLLEITDIDVAVGAVSDNFAVTTIAVEDTEPDPFVFTDRTDVPPGSFVFELVVVSGINTPAVVTVSFGDAYSINGGAYQGTPGIVNDGDVVTLRVAASPNANSPSSGTLNIGGISDTLNVISGVITTGTGADLLVDSRVVIDARYRGGFVDGDTEADLIATATALVINNGPEVATDVWLKVQFDFVDGRSFDFQFDTGNSQLLKFQFTTWKFFGLPAGVICTSQDPQGPAQGPDSNGLVDSQFTFDPYFCSLGDLAPGEARVIVRKVSSNNIVNNDFFLAYDTTYTVGIGSTVDLGTDTVAANNVAGGSILLVLPFPLAGGGNADEQGFLPCAITQAAVGSYLAAELTVLRDFRDRYLKTSRIGRWVVDAYYRSSPAVIRAMERVPALKGIVRTLLAPVVYAIKYLGVPTFALLGAALIPLMAIWRRRRRTGLKKQ